MIIRRISNDGNLGALESVDTFKAMELVVENHAVIVGEIKVVQFTAGRLVAGR